MDQRLEINVPAGTSRTRLEDFLFDKFPNLSRMYLRDVVRMGKCEVNGRLENVGCRIRGGDFIEIDIDPTRENAMMPEDIALDIVFEDPSLVVIDKPSGMLVHPTHRDKSGTMLNALAFYLNRGADTNASERSPASTRVVRPGLVHRLDKQTSGLIVVAKSVDAHRKLARQFQKKTVEKRYLALVDGSTKDEDGVIEGSIGRYAELKHWNLKEDGKESITRFRVRARFEESTLLELEPVTGRTNQLRIHCASIGHPIVGDIARGGSEYERLCLHAWKLAFRHPSTNEVVRFERELDFRI